jgi:hypothetical protein
MSRELRRVPAGYQHPMCYNPYRQRMVHVQVANETLAEAQADWRHGLEMWLVGKDAFWADWCDGIRQEIETAETDEERAALQVRLNSLVKNEFHDEECSEECYIEEKGEMPEEPEPGAMEIYRTWNDKDPTLWFQVWQTVGAGSPVTPCFATREELVHWLCHNYEWDEKSQPNFNSRPWSKKAAEKFVHGDGWFPSGIQVEGENFIRTASEGFPS